MKVSLPRLLVWFPTLLPFLLAGVLCGPPPAILSVTAPAAIVRPGPPGALPPGPAVAGLGGIRGPRALGPHKSTGTTYHSDSTATSSTSTLSVNPGGPLQYTTTATSITSSSSTLAPTSTSLPSDGTTSSVATGQIMPSTSVYVVSPSTSPLTQASTPMSHQHRDLIIILSVVLGVVGILIFSLSILLIYRCRKGKAPFGSRGASPINDDEIQSWRNTSHEAKHVHSSSDPRSIITRDVSIDSIALGQAPRWGPYSAHSNMVLPNLPPSALGRAPNAREGLTDETVPGDAPFVPTTKRQNSRLAKAPPGHVRTKSRRSSTSAKSTRSYSGAGRIVTWYDHESSEMKEVGDPSSSSPGTSIWDGQSGGGLSPPPKSQLMPWDREDDIGRAT